MPDGSHKELLPIEEVSNGVAGHNYDSINIAYMGGIDDEGNPIDNRTTEQKENMAILVNSLYEAFPNAKILGHRDLSPDTNGNGKVEETEWLKDCPCFDVNKWLDEIFKGNY